MPEPKIIANLAELKQERARLMQVIDAAEAVECGDNSPIWFPERDDAEEKVAKIDRLLGLYEKMERQ